MPEIKSKHEIKINKYKYPKSKSKMKKKILVSNPE
jgi:hypothetical protein